MTGFIERVLSVQTLNNKRGCTQRVIVVNDVAQQFDDMPTPSADTLGLIVQYTGETTADFTHGYFYEGSSSTTSSSATATQTVGSGLTDIAVDVETLETFTGWTTDNSLQIFYTDDGWSVDTTSLGVTYTGTPSVGDAITISYTAGVTTYGWQQVDVQPSGGGSSLPDQTGHSGEFLTTDGTDASWAAVDSLPSQTGHSGEFLTTDGTDASWATVDGLPSQTGNAGKFLTTDGTDASWSDNLTKVNTTVTLAAANWSSNTQTVTVSGITSTGVVLVSPDPTDQADYTDAGIICTSQATDSLTFTATTTPANDIDVVVVML